MPALQRVIVNFARFDAQSRTFARQTPAKVLKENNIDVQLIGSAHSPRPGTPDDLQDALDKDAAVISQR
jgi:hypothetical protein